MRKVAIVTGSSKGIGYATSELLAKNGYIVYGFARSKTDIEGVNSVICDVTDSTMLAQKYQEIYDKEGSIDLLVNNAGLGISGAVEVTTDEAVNKIVKLNLSALEKSCRLAVPYLRKSKGRIINLSSVAGLLPIPFQTYYTATKSAVLMFSRALNLELRPLGVKVVSVLPGDTKTSFTEARQRSFEGSEIYGERIKRSVEKMEKDEQNGVPPIKVAKVIYKMATKKSPKPYVVVGLDYKFLVLLTRLLPTRFVDYILYQMYAK